MSAHSPFEKALIGLAEAYHLASDCGHHHARNWRLPCQVCNARTERIAKEIRELVDDESVRRHMADGHDKRDGNLVKSREKKEEETSTEQQFPHNPPRLDHWERCCPPDATHAIALIDPLMPETVGKAFPIHKRDQGDVIVKLAPGDRSAYRTYYSGEFAYVKKAEKEVAEG